MAELSLRHLPDLNASGVGDFSDSSFQIPSAAHHADDLLLVNDTMDFFNNANITLTTPAPPTRPRVQPPLTLAELTPHKSTRIAPIRSSLRPQPGIATPDRAAVVSELSNALSQDFSPFRNQGTSFQIAPIRTYDDLLADNDNNFFSQEVPVVDASHSRLCSPLTPFHLKPTPTFSSVPSTDPSLQTSLSKPISLPQDNDQDVDHGRLRVPADNGFPDTPSASTLVSLPKVSGAVPEGCKDTITQKGNDKVLLKTNRRQKKLPSGDKPKRKQVAASATASTSAKLNPLTASIARRLSKPGKKPILASRRRPLVEAPTLDLNPRRFVAERANAPTLADDVKPFQAGRLADTLLSFGQKLMASTEPCGEVSRVPSCAAGSFEAMAASEEGGYRARGCSQTDTDAGHCVQLVVDSDYLTFSQLSPRKTITESLSAVSVPRIGDEAPAVTEPVAERPPSPMHHSGKREGSPVDTLTNRRKRSKTTSEMSATLSSKEVRPSKPLLQPSRAKNALAVASSSGRSGPSRTRRVMSATVTVNGAGRNKGTDVIKKPDAGVLQSRSLSKTVPDGENDPAAQTGKKSTTSSQSHRRTAPGRSGRSNAQIENVSGGTESLTDGQTHGRPTSADDRPCTNLPPAKPTRPVEFQFATSSRMEGRSKGDLTNLQAGVGMSLQRSKTHAAHPIPDFKALHAAQDSVLAQRRACIQPTVPMQFGLATEARAHERDKFEEARRERERELERLAEERRRQRELEEEAEIRELRRRAVPKANEVPEWYAYAPKKAKADPGN